ncbi:MAG: hypothetical protein ACXVYU_01450 [Oryzihumus sp.]
MTLLGRRQTPATTTPAPATEHRDPRWLAPAFALFTVAATVKLGVRAVSDPDTWWHLKTGELVLHGGSFAGPDPWVPASTRPFVLTQWLPEVVAAKANELAGLPGVAWLRCAAMLALLGALVWACRRVADSVPAVIAAIAALVGTGGSLSERPQLVSFVLLAVTVGAWWRTADDLRPRWWLVPLTWVWACCHGLWSVGPVVGVVFVAGLVLDRRVGRAAALRLLLVPALSVVVAALTPVGPRLLLTPFQVGSTASRFVQEWQPTTVGNVFAVVVLVMVATTVLVWVRSGRPTSWLSLLLAAASVVATLAMLRTVAVGATLAAPLLAGALQGLRSARPTRAGRREVLAWLAALVVAAALAMPLCGQVAARPSGVPTGLSAPLSALPKGTVVLDDFAQSGWLLWSQPQLVPVIDLRSEIYDPAYIDAYRRAEAVRPGWQEFVQHTGARVAVLETRSPLALALREERGWRVTASKARFSLLEAPTTS